jgi:hypothetical protein
MRFTVVTLALLSGAVFFSAENANAQGCPSGQYAHGRCMEGPPKQQTGSAKSTSQSCPSGKRAMGRCIQ